MPSQVDLTSFWIILAKRTRAAAPLVASCSLALLLLFGAGCATTQITSGRSMKSVVRPTVTPTRGEVGMASYYANRYHDKKTASGEVYNMHQMTAAHRRLPFGAKVRVTNLRNNRSVVVRINDRGPFARGRIIDLSLAAARHLEMVKAGVARVQVDPANQQPEPSVATATP